MYKYITYIIALVVAFSACESEVTSVNSCGDGFLDPGEECDGVVPEEVSCVSLGYYSQLSPLSCKKDCTIDRSVCAGRSGDRVIQLTQGELCDGENLDGATCESLELGEGTLVCDVDCRYDTSGCAIHRDCGDGVATAPAEA